MPPEARPARLLIRPPHEIPDTPLYSGRRPAQERVGSIRGEQCAAMRGGGHWTVSGENSRRRKDDVDKNGTFRRQEERSIDVAPTTL